MLVSHMMEVLVECRMKYHGKMLLSCHFKSNMDHFWAISGGQGVIYNFSHLFHAYLSHPGLQIGLGHDREACEFHVLKPREQKL